MGTIQLPEGLTTAAAQELLREYGPNTVSSARGRTPFQELLRQVASPLVILLLAAAGISAFFGDIRSFAVITAMVVISTALDFWNTYRSSKAVQELQKTIRVRVTVIRDGAETGVPLEYLVPGDMVRLHVGDIVPADGIITLSEHCYVNESVLNGESFPVLKDTGDEVWMGSSVSSGEGWMRVAQTGAQTQFNHIVRHLSEREGETEFDRETRSFSFLILRATLVLVLFVFGVNALRHQPLLESLLFAMALAVGMTPEMMPIIITLNLTRGSLAMGRRGVIVKRLSSIQNFGSMDVLCTDKTGTLTEDRIVLIRCVDANGTDNEEVLRMAYLNSQFSDGFTNPLDAAIEERAPMSLEGYHKVYELPFDFQRRRESVVVAHDSERTLITKGSPESVLSVCARAVGEGATPLQQVLLRASQTCQSLYEQGFRVLAIASKTVPDHAEFSVADETGMTFRGLLAFLDPPKESAGPTIRQMRDRGIAVKIVTGDHEKVAQQVAHQIGFDITGVLTGQDIDPLSDDALVEATRGVNLFARVNPDQKLRIIRTLRQHGHVVGYIGDGINDAPSLKAADVGISVSNATDIARESADMIMVERDLQSLLLAVLEGRRTFVNTTKYLLMVLSSNFGNMLSMAAASVFLPFLPMRPEQVLLNNLLYDSSQFLLPSDRVDADDLGFPKRLSLMVVRRFMLIMGPISSVFDFLTFLLLGWLLHLPEAQFQTGWFLESLLTQILVVFVIRTKHVPFLDSVPSTGLLLGAMAMIGMGWGVALSSLGAVFQFSAPNTLALMAVVTTAIIYLLLVELVKRWFYAHMVPAQERQQM